MLPLLAGRLVVAFGILVGALALTAERARAGTDVPERALYATVVLAFVTTILAAIVNSRIRRRRAFAGLQLVSDVAIVSALVHFSGGADSFFGFLYVPITVYAALLFGRRGAYAASALGAVGYGTVLLIAHWESMARGAQAADPVQLAVWGLNAGALMLVALLASALSRERDRAGRALAETSRDLASLQRLHQRTVESLTSGLITTDPSGQITSWNPEAERITGAPVADVLGRALDDVIPGAHARVLEAAGSGEKFRARLRHRNRRGEDLHLGLAGSRLLVGDGDPGGYVVIFQDVTKGVEMEAELRRHERLAGIGQLAADLAHEIRNPLAAISGSIQILEGGAEGEESDEARRLMNIVVRETDRLNALITDFLLFARPAPARPEPVAIETVLRDMAQLFESVRPPSVELVIDAPPELRVVADDRQLRQLLWNLFLNAVQAMPDGGRLEIRAQRAAAQGAALERRNGNAEGPPWVEIRVADTGTGIAEDVLERIFDPFFTTKKEGSGLGLATVHRIVEGNGGHVKVESAVDRGTRFCVLLPAADRAR
ncbi:MAG: ATP-binding protein [Proteobacteria bacterium]|nr:ATP-binding protein [Pseudomonadota bacterium]